jgi:beta-lactamase regulating signal transducer with metallopeptidase domain
MIATWMLYATIIAALVAAAAAALDSVIALLGWPRRWLWAAAFAIALVGPVAGAWAPAARPGAGKQAVIERITLHQPSTPVAQNEPALLEKLSALLPSADALRRFDPALAIGWAGSVLGLLAVYGAGGVVLVRRRRRWAVQEMDGERIFVAASTGPAVVGILDPRIVLPRWALAATPAERQMMLAHEREHVRAKDPVLLHAAALLLAATPWTLALWGLLGRVRTAVEIDCDARVLAAGHDRAGYGALLLAVGARHARMPFVAPALIEGVSALTRRVHAMYPRVRRFAELRAAWSASMAVALVVIACRAPAPAVAPPARMAAGTPARSDVVDTSRPGWQAMIVKQYFPDVLRPGAEPTLLWVVTDTGKKVLATGQTRVTDRARATLGRDSAAAGGRRGGKNFDATPFPALRADDISTVEVIKQSGSATGLPVPVNFIVISLKAGASPGPVRRYQHLEAF